MLQLSKGQQLANRYSLVRRIGGGGEAEIWLASDRLTKTSVALKIVPAEHAARLRAEWQTAIRLMHAHIVRVFEFHAEDDLAFYSQQFIDGPDLTVVAGRPPADVLAPIGLLADALRYLHGKGIVHRDIKASNVLIDGNGAPYLSDFGVAQAIGGSATGGATIAQSPEALDGAPAAPADDVFALGGLMYELLTGRSPWSSADTAASIRSAEPEPPAGADGSTLPAPVVDLIERMLAKDPADRPEAAAVAEGLAAAGFSPAPAPVKASARSVADEEIVESVRSIRPVQPAGDGSAKLPVESASGINRRTMFAALAGLLVVLVAVIFVLPDRVEQAREQDDRPSPVLVIEPDSDEPVVVDRAEGKTGVYVDPEIRARLEGRSVLPVRKLEGDEDITFSENMADYSGLDEEARNRLRAERALGELLSAFEVLEGRGIERWASVDHRRAREHYADGDKAYLEKRFIDAEDYYLGALTILEPTYAQIEPTFKKALAAAQAAFASGDRLEALQQYELAVAITPSHAGAQQGLKRAKNLEAVTRLVDQGVEYEEDYDLVAAQSSFERAIELDELWQPAHEGLERVKVARTELEFDTRMSEGFEALAVGDYLGARAAFRTAQKLIPSSPEVADGLLQVDQGLRLDQIVVLEREAQSLEADEHWDAAVNTYEEILEVDSTLTFASDGLAHARDMKALHERLDGYITDPDKLSAPPVMQQATKLVVDITTRGEVGPRLAGQRDELSRLLKRAATTLTVSLVSDNATNVAVYKVGRLGTFMRRELELRPGTYVAVGSRSGYRDVRLEFRVAPEIDMQPVIIQCEEPI